MESSPSPGRVAVVSAQWHADIVERQVESFRQRLTDDGWSVDWFRVPGAFELPLRVKRLALSGDYCAVAACALVVDGGIYRHEFVAGSVVDALMRVQLETDVPVFSGVLTPHNYHEHDEHREYFAHHFAVKGDELARAVIATVAAPAGPVGEAGSA